jgi:hypothetical protein
MEARRKTRTDEQKGAGILPASFDVQGSHVTVVARSAAGRTVVTAFARVIADRPEARSVWGDSNRLYVHLEVQPGTDAWTIVVACVDAIGMDGSLVRPPRRSLGWS